MASTSDPVQISQVTSDIFRKYKREYVLWALRKPAEYLEWRKGEIQTMQEQINKAPEDSAFKNGCQWHLYRLQDTSPPGPVAPPSEPKNLSHLAYYQIERLKDLSNSWIATPNMDVSIQAVIQAYRAGDLDADPTLISYWLNGQMVHGPSSDKVEDLAAKTREWTEKYGPGQIHIEQVVVDLPTQQAAVAIYEADPDPSKDNKDKVIGPKPSFHHYWVEITMPDMPLADQRKARVKLLDDSGSSLLELFITDCLRLGFDPRTNIPPQIRGLDVPLATCNGPIQARVVHVSAQLVDEKNNLFGDVIPLTAAISDAPVATRSRCSGQAIRSSFFTASAPWQVKVRPPKPPGATHAPPEILKDHPDGGKLIVAEHKSHLMNNMVAKP